MDLKEIVNRDLSHPIEQEESLFVIKEYIKLRKGIDINPVIITDIPQPFVAQQLNLMAEMALFAIIWMRNNIKTI